MADEWSPWVEHDGRGCPVVGLFCHVIGEGARGEHHEVQMIVRDHPCWDWSNFGKPGSDRGRCGVWAKVTRYRIRKPRALLDLIEMAESLSAPQPQRLPEIANAS